MNRGYPMRRSFNNGRASARLLSGLLSLPFFFVADQAMSQDSAAEVSAAEVSAAEVSAAEESVSDEASNEAPSRDEPSSLRHFEEALELSPHFEAEPIVVTGTRTKLQQIDASQAVSVVSREDLHRERPLEVGRAIEGVPGVHLVERGPLMTNPAIRGLSGRRVVMLVDGLRIESSKTMGVSGYFVNMDDVERIEVIRGPTSVMYGTDALGGVVNTVTRDGFDEKGFHGGYRLSIDTNSSELSNSLGLSYGAEHWFLRASGRWRDAESAFDGAGEEIASSQYGDRVANVEGGLRFGGHRVILASQSYFGRDIGKVSSAEDIARFREIAFPEEDNHRLSLRYLFEGNGVLEQLGAAALWNLTNRHQRMESYSTGWTRPLSQVDKYGDFNVVEGQIFSTLRFGERHRLTVGTSAVANFYNSTKSGFGYLPDGTPMDATSEVEFDNIRSLSIGIYAQEEWQIASSLRLTIGLRYDTVESWGALETGAPHQHEHESAISGNLGMTYRPVEAVALIVNGGRAFRAASLREQFFFGSTCFGVFCGTPGLEPETSWNVEAGARVRFGPVDFETFSFHSFVNDLITAPPAPAGSECDYIYENTDNAWLTGVDGQLAARRIRLGHDALNLRAYFKFAWVRAENRDSGAPIPQTPPARLQVGLRLFGSGQGIRQYYVEARTSVTFSQDRVSEGEMPTGSYVLVDAFAGIEFPRFLFFETARINLRLSNIGDIYYQNHLAISPGTGRSLRVGLDLDF
jgi:outer membrane receptor protein involved in Fe transport